MRPDDSLSGARLLARPVDRAACVTDGQHLDGEHAAQQAAQRDPDRPSVRSKLPSRRNRRRSSRDNAGDCAAVLVRCESEGVGRVGYVIVIEREVVIGREIGRAVVKAVVDDERPPAGTCMAIGLFVLRRLCAAVPDAVIRLVD